jgi:hypothetical protein
MNTYSNDTFWTDRAGDQASRLHCGLRAFEIIQCIVDSVSVEEGHGGTTMAKCPFCTETAEGASGATPASGANSMGSFTKRFFSDPTGSVRDGWEYEHIRQVWLAMVMESRP